mgnify:CR=1 FL=1
MEISDAILIGAKKRKQGFRNYFDIDWNLFNAYLYNQEITTMPDYDDSRFICSCALGAAVEAVNAKIPFKFCSKTKNRFQENSEAVLTFLIKQFPRLIERIPFAVANKYMKFDIPDDDPEYKDGFRIVDLIGNLNDNTRLSREQIAGILKELGY